MSDKGKTVSIYTCPINPDQAQKLEAILLMRDWESKQVPYANFAFSGPKVQIVAYKSGKLVVQGKGTQEFVQMTLEPEVLGEVGLGYEEVNHPDWFEPHAGCDEAGKGDIFGPLVTACVVSDAQGVQAFLKAGVCDSKRLSDSKALALDKVIRATPNVSIGLMKLRMEKYNQLMSRPGANLNNLLSWLHAKSLAEALDKKSVQWGLLDQFARHDRVQTYLARDGFELRRRTKAESDPVVAAASIVARAAFLNALKQLGDSIGQDLPKGSSIAAQHFFKKLRDAHGSDKMAQLAKLHFKLRAIS